MIWTEERVALMRRLWAEGLTASQIAVRLDGASRNAVIGKLHRMKLSADGQADAPRPVRTRAAVAPRPAVADGEAAAPARFTAVAILVEEPGLATFSSLEAHMCRWPIGDPAADDFSFCGQALALGRPYCAQHSRTAYRPGPAAGSARMGAEINRMIARYA